MTEKEGGKERERERGGGREREREWLHVSLEGVAKILLMSKTRRMCRLLVDCDGPMTPPTSENKQHNEGATSSSKERENHAHVQYGLYQWATVPFKDTFLVRGY